MKYSFKPNETYQCTNINFNNQSIIQPVLLLVSAQININFFLYKNCKPPPEIYWKPLV